MATRSLREALHNPLGNVLVFTREEETPIRLQLSLFEKAPGLKSFFLNPNYQRRMQRRHKFLQNGRPAGIEYILDLVPPSEGEEAVDAVENMYCPPSVQRWKCQLERWVDAKRPWVEDDDGGEYWLRKSDQEIALDKFRATYEVDMKKKKEAEGLAAEEAVAQLEEEEEEEEEALHQEQRENALRDVEDGLYPPWEEYCHNRNEYVRPLPPAQALAARPATPTLPAPPPPMPVSPTIPVFPTVHASPTIPAPPPPVVEEAEVQQEDGNCDDHIFDHIFDIDEDTLAPPPMPAALPPIKGVRGDLRPEAEKQFDALLILVKAVETPGATDSPTATWTQAAGQPGPTLLATDHQFDEPSQSFGAPGTPRPRRLSGSSSASASSVTEIPQATVPSSERYYRKDLETAKALSLEYQQSLTQILPPVVETIPPAYSRTRHSGAIERILAVMCGEDPHIYSAPMWYTIYRVACTLSCEALVVDHILLWLYASPGFIELFTPLCVQMATDLRAPALYRECFALCVAREISSSTPLHPVNLADFPEPTRLAVTIASASFKKRLDQAWEYLASLKWLDELAHFPRLNPDDAATIKIYLRYRFNALMEDGIESLHDTPLAPPAPHPSIPLGIYNAWRRGVNNECTPQTRHYNAYIWLQIRDLRWNRYEMPECGLDEYIKHELRAIADGILYNELSEPSDFMMLVGLYDEQWACMPAWARGEEEETRPERDESRDMGEKEFECGSEPSDLGKFECGSEPSDLARSAETESWDGVSEVGSVLTLCEPTGDMDEEYMVEVADEVTEEIDDLDLDSEEDDGWDTDMTIS